MQLHVHLAYADVYHFKAALEKVKGSTDLKDMIKGFEDVETVYSLGKMKYQTQRVKPFFHSTVRIDPKNPYKVYPGYMFLLHAQLQKDGKIVYISESAAENEESDRQILECQGLQETGRTEKVSHRAVTCQGRKGGPRKGPPFLLTQRGSRRQPHCFLFSFYPQGSIKTANLGNAERRFHDPGTRSAAL